MFVNGNDAVKTIIFVFFRKTFMNLCYYFTVIFVSKSVFSSVYFTVTFRTSFLVRAGGMSVQLSREALIRGVREEICSGMVR